MNVASIDTHRTDATKPLIGSAKKGPLACL
jgi:hypothetical protein